MLDAVEAELGWGSTEGGGLKACEQEAVSSFLRWLKFSSEDSTFSMSIFLRVVSSSPSIVDFAISKA